jgi:hypothetical protein
MAAQLTNLSRPLPGIGAVSRTVARPAYDARPVPS